MFKVLDRETNQYRTTLDCSTKDEMEALFRAAGRAGRLVCPYCSEQVLFRCADIYTPHFAHKPASKCPFESDSLPILRARAALYLFLKERYGSKVEIEHVPGRWTLHRPIDCWVQHAPKPFAYWLMERGVRGREHAHQLRETLKKWKASIQFLFLSQMLRPVLGHKTIYRLSPTEQALSRRSVFDNIYTWSGSEKYGSLDYIDATEEAARIITLRSVAETNCGGHFNAAAVLRTNLEKVSIAPETGELTHPGEREDLGKAIIEGKERREREAKERMKERPVDSRPPLTWAEKIARAAIADLKRRGDSAEPKDAAPAPPAERPLPQVALEALAMQQKNGVVILENGEREAACESCGVFTADWMSFDGKTGVCKCNDCYQPARRKVPNPNREQSQQEGTIGKGEVA